VDRLKTRLATPDEQQSWGLFWEGYETHCLVLEEDERVIGRVALSRCPAGVFGHDWQHWGSDILGTAIMYKAVKKLIQEWGNPPFWVHFPPEGAMTEEFWLRRGFKKEMILLRGEL
jgi:hypothetical protein